MLIDSGVREGAHGRPSGCRIAPLALTFVLPPSLGRAKAVARAELVEATLSRELDEPVTAIVASTYADLEDRLLAAKADLVWAPAAACVNLAWAPALFTIVREGRAS